MDFHTGRETGDILLRVDTSGPGTTWGQGRCSPAAPSGHRAGRPLTVLPECDSGLRLRPTPAPASPLMRLCAGSRAGDRGTPTSLFFGALFCYSGSLGFPSEFQDQLVNFCKMKEKAAVILLQTELNLSPWQVSPSYHRFLTRGRGPFLPLFGPLFRRRCVVFSVQVSYSFC